MKKRAFTLIELLVVIAIIAILATIILIVLSNARPKALKSAAVESFNRAFEVANICVSADNGIVNVPSYSGTIYAGGNAICTATDPSATGTWPTLPDGYSNIDIADSDGATAGAQINSVTFHEDTGNAISCSGATNAIKCK